MERNRMATHNKITFYFGDIIIIKNNTAYLKHSLVYLYYFNYNNKFT